MKRLHNLGWLAFVLLLIFTVSTIDYRMELQAENDKLKRAFNAVLNAEGEGSCGVMNNGPRIGCQMINRAVRVELAPDPDRCPPKRKGKR